MSEGTTSAVIESSNVFIDFDTAGHVESALWISNSLTDGNLTMGNSSLEIDNSSIWSPISTVGAGDIECYSSRIFSINKNNATGNIELKNCNVETLTLNNSAIGIATSDTTINSVTGATNASWINKSYNNISTATFSSPPTLAQLTAAFGTPSSVGKDFQGSINSGGTGTTFYVVKSDGTNYWTVAGTKAV